MPTNQLGQQTAVSRRRRRFPWKLVIFVIMMILIIVVAAVLVIVLKNIELVLTLSGVMLAILGVFVNLFQWLFPVPVEISNDDPLNSQQPRGERIPNEHQITTEQQTTMSSQKMLAPVTSSVFFFNEPLPRVQEFYGRVSERNTVIKRARNRASTSIIGPRRIGKTWLLEYTEKFLSNEPDHIFLVGYLDVSTPGCRTVSQFTSLAIEALGASNVRARGLDRLGSFVRAQRQQKRIPVLLIEKFEALTNFPAEFDLEFFDGLRSIANAGLVLVTASRESLVTIAGESTRTSPFFNIFEQVKLKPFLRNEAEKFVQEKSEQARFTTEEQEALLKYGASGVEQWPPLRLQRAGKLLLDDKQNPGRYSPNDPHYWEELERRLEEKY